MLSRVANRSAKMNVFDSMEPSLEERDKGSKPETMKKYAGRGKIPRRRKTREMV